MSLINWAGVCFGLPMLTSFFGIHLCLPIIIRLSLKSKQGVDTTDERKIHQHPTPRIGGIGVFISFCTSSLIPYFSTQGQIVEGQSSHFFGLLLGAALIFGLGLVDDFKGLKGRWKLFVQILTALIVFFFGLAIEQVHFPLVGQFILPSYCAVLLSIFWIVGITNTLNLVDGLDGLSSGTTSIASLGLSVIALLTGKTWLAAILLILCTSSIAFLQYNWPPAKVFVGDSGAYLYGFVLAVVSILVCYNSQKSSLVYAPVILLGVPITDTTFAILRRLRRKEPVFAADRQHLHHKLLSLGYLINIDSPHDFN